MATTGSVPRRLLLLYVLVGGIVVGLACVSPWPSCDVGAVRPAVVPHGPDGTGR